jgi:hypothetical protein
VVLQRSFWEHKLEVIKSDLNAFIFSLTNKDNQPLKMKIHPNKDDGAIYCHSSCGPIFGGGFDIFISNNANKTMDGSSHLGFSYKHPQYAHGTNEAQLFLAGSFHFNWMKLKSIKKNEK